MTVQNFGPLMGLRAHCLDFENVVHQLDVTTAFVGCHSRYVDRILEPNMWANQEFHSMQSDT
jgi:hypothetical protein